VVALESEQGRSNVSDANIVISTVNAAAMATPFKNESCSTSIPSSAMHTVEPAKSTARPEVLIAVTIASSELKPRSNLSSSRDNKEGVVDPDAEADE